MSDLGASTWRERTRALAWSWILNSLAGCLVGWPWIASGASSRSLVAQLFACAALLSSVAILALLPFALLALVSLVVRSSRALAWLASGVWTAFLFVLYADTVVYGLFRYHFNGMVWNVLTTPGAEDAVVIDAWTWWRAAIGAAIVLALEILVWKRICAPRARAVAPARSRLRFAVAALLAIVVVEKGMYAWADLHRDRRITALAGLYPLYQRLTVERLANKVFGMKLDARPSVALASEGILLQYPLEVPRIEATGEHGARPNVLLIVIDSLRADMLAPETMPRASEYAKRARVFENHLSGGNATRYGVFSLVYGIHGAYWNSVLEEQAPPVLVTSLQRAGYDLRVLSGPSHNYPEFRSTCWVTMEERVQDKLVEAATPDSKRDKIAAKIAAKIAGDQEVARRFGAWMDERATQPKKAPFFCFALIDAPHGSYAWPREETKFEPVAKSVDYLQLARSPTREQIDPVWNMYRNAVRYSDRLAGEMLDALARAGELDDTLVVITGDHGEEFFESGFFGHTSNFTPEQVHVSFVLGGPGVPVGRETRPTSHLDLAPTILRRLGADDSMRERWTSGVDLLDPPSHRVRAIASWDEMALWIDADRDPSTGYAPPQGILRIPMQGHRGLVEAFDAHWRTLADEESFVRSHGADVARLAAECRRFLR